jgi:NTP pyrophosphatase (non-canonical NTP hydrolase)
MIPDFPSDDSLSGLQAYQSAVCKARGWDKTSDLETFLLFSEEIGELARAIRNHRELYQEPGRTKKREELPGEFADVLSYLLELANRLGVDLAEAYREKEARNAGRNWD